MGEFKKSGGFGRGGNPRTKRAEQSSYDGSNQGRGFNRGGHSDRPRFGGEKRSFSHSGDRDKSRPQMFSAVCSECNRTCEVPFRPTGDRPVFCNDCFSNKRGSSQGGHPRRDASPARGFPQRDFTQLTPSSKPPTEDKRINELKQQLDAVNKKLDTVIEMMKVVPVAEAAKAVPTKKAKVRKLATATREPGERSSRRMTAKK